MANKSIANQLNVQILVLVLKSLQNSHHDFKVCFKICKHQVSIKTEDEALMSVEFSCFSAFPFKCFWLSAIFTILFHLNFLHANFICVIEIKLQYIKEMSLLEPRANIIIAHYKTSWLAWGSFLETQTIVYALSSGLFMSLCSNWGLGNQHKNTGAVTTTISVSKKLSFVSHLGISFVLPAFLKPEYSELKI